MYLESDRLANDGIRTLFLNKQRQQWVKDYTKSCRTARTLTYINIIYLLGKLVFNLFDVDFSSGIGRNEI